MKTKNYTKLHGYENEKVRNEEELEDDSNIFSDGTDTLDDDFYSDDYNIFGDDDSSFSSIYDTPFGTPFRTPFGCGMDCGNLDNKKKFRFFNKNRKPDYAITNEDVEEANIKGFVTGMITGVLGLLSLLVLIKYIIFKK